ncbi:hypothetical protein AB0903_08990 [Streptomyces sp. NPDC048389]|uniref:hypothetical protein n=1 Tax=Streptomyces sp. NPDC048389 TaxID=3154622 RepID=UPI00345167E6
MAKTGPQKYPGASTAYWYQSKFGGSAMESNVGVMHTTEGRTLPSYGGGASAPNFTAVPDIPNKRLRWYQHFDFDVSSRALVNRTGGVQTNTANAVQIELVGTCDERHATSWDGKRAGLDYLFWPAAPDWALAELAKFVKWAHDAHGIRLQSTVTWKPYKKGQVGGSYGANGVRLTGTQWNAYHGWLGHQHVPENDHGDPGDLDFARVLAHATGVKNTSPEEDDMPTAREVAEEVVELLATKDGHFPAPRDAADYSPDPENPKHYWALGTHERAQTEGIRAVRRELAAQTAAITALAHLVGTGADTDTIVAAVRQEIRDAVITVDVDITGTPAA